MGVEKNIAIDKFPEQGSHLLAKVQVCFHYDTGKTIEGLVVRDDNEEPFRTIIQLKDGRLVLGTECQYHIVSYHPSKALQNNIRSSD